jgi:hypothetical protein
MSVMADLHIEITQLLKAKWSWGEIADQIVSQYKVPKDWAIQQVRAVEEVMFPS